MESQVQEEKKVPRSELDAAFDGSRTWGGMVVQVPSSSPWGYVMWPLGGESYDWLASALDLPRNR